MSHSHKVLPPFTERKTRKKNTFITLDSTTVFLLRYLFYQKESETGALISPFSLKYGHLKQSPSKVFPRTTICSRLCKQLL